jgi:hypothetical protein
MWGKMSEGGKEGEGDRLCIVYGWIMNCDLCLATSVIFVLTLLKSYTEAPGHFVCNALSLFKWVD